MAHPSWGGLKLDGRGSEKTMWWEPFFTALVKVPTWLRLLLETGQLTEKLNPDVKWKCFFLWLLFITSDLSCMFLCSSCTLVTLQSPGSFPRNHRISFYHMWASPSFRLGERLLLNHLMVKQWTAIFSPPEALGLWPLPGVILGVMKLLVQLNGSCFLSKDGMNNRMNRIPQVGSWQDLFWTKGA